MVQGASGRIVIEVDPDIKTRLYHALSADDMTLKDWFLQEARRVVADFESARDRANAMKGVEK